MKLLGNIRHRYFLPALAALGLFGTGLGYAVHGYAQGGDCCYEGSPCCHPGAACCAAHHEATAQN